MSKNARDIGKIFSPLQIGFIADCIEPLSAGSEAGWALELLSDRPDLQVVPIERDGAVLGVISRHVLQDLVGSAWKRFWQKDLDAYVIQAKGTVEATDYVDRIVAKGLETSAGDEPDWYIVQHRRSYLGIVNLQQMLEYLNELRAQDLKRAGEIQQHLLDKPVPEDDRFKTCFFNRMAHEIGGDFYRSITLGPDNFLVACFDVAGKNISGSLATTALGAFFSAIRLFSYSGTPKKTTELLNALIRDVNPDDVFVAGVLFYIDFSVNSIEIHNCGFSPVVAFVPQQDKKISCRMAKPNLPPLGIQEQFELDTVHRIHLSPGLRLTAFSDGLTDMTNPFGERYGDDKTTTFLQKAHTVPHKELIPLLNEEIDKWIGEAHLADDITLVDIRFN